MPILLLTTDLMASSKLAAAAQRAGGTMATALSVQDLFQRLEEQPDAVVVLDLQTAGLNVAGLVPQLHERPVPPRAILAFGPHVHEAKLAAARQAGCTEVFSRGQFHAAADEVFAKLLQP